MNNATLLDNILENTTKASNEFQDAFTNYKHHGLSSARLKDSKANFNPSVNNWLVAAGMDWTVEEAPVQYSHMGNLVTSDSDKVVFRSDTLAPLGIFKNGYRSIQNQEILDFFSEYCSEIGAKITQVGMADNGAKVYAYADLETEVRLVGNDVGSKKLLLIDSRDGSIGFTKLPFFERLICFNQLKAAGSKFGKSSHRHTKSFSFDDVARDLEVYNNNFDSMFVSLNKLAKESISSGEALTVLYDLHVPVDKNIDDVGTRTLNNIIAMHDKFMGAGIGSNMPEARGTMYGLLNAVTEFYDHDAGRNENTRFKSKTIGSGASKKTEALNCLEAILEGEIELENRSSQILERVYKNRT